jgi:hypothetical protein
VYDAAMKRKAVAGLIALVAVLFAAGLIAQAQPPAIMQNITGPIVGNATTSP